MPRQKKPKVREIKSKIKVIEITEGEEEDQKEEFESSSEERAMPSERTSSGVTSIIEAHEVEGGRSSREPVETREEQIEELPAEGGSTARYAVSTGTYRASVGYEEGEKRKYEVSKDEQERMDLLESDRRVEMMQRQMTSRESVVSDRQINRFEGQNFRASAPQVELEEKYSLKTENTGEKKKRLPWE